MNITQADLPPYGIDWTHMQGSADALKFARRDLWTVREALKLVPEQRVCVQAGGCVGVFPKYLAQTFEEVYTFEPMAHSFQKLVANAPEANIHPHFAALGYNRTPIGMKQVRRTKTHAPAHEGIAHVSGSGKVPVIRVDDLPLEHCDFLCLDLEGYELEALKGAEATIARCRPVLMVEVNENCRHYGRKEADVRTWIADRGYRLVFRKHSDDVYVPKEWQ